MRLSDLTAYAEEKYGIEEEYKWENFPDFSVLCSPGNGKWIALLMRQWDPREGVKVERCDIKCGRNADFGGLAVSPSFRMKGPDWVGIPIGEGTDATAVFALLDEAVRRSQPPNPLIVLDSQPSANVKDMIYQMIAGSLAGAVPGVFTATSIPPRRKTDAKGEDGEAHGTEGSSRDSARRDSRIETMRSLYDPGKYRFQDKCRNFYVQGKFMEDYEEHADSIDQLNEYKHYFTTYHDLTRSRLHVYFAWRTLARQGDFRPISISVAYMYFYELLCGIGTSSPQDALDKMESFVNGFVKAGHGGTGMADNTRRWMFEFCVVNGFDAQTAKKYADPDMLKTDGNLAVLKDAASHSDEEVFAALRAFGGARLGDTPILGLDDVDGTHLFASLWRIAQESYTVEGKDLFTACFGQRRAYAFHPFGNAIYWREEPYPDATYELDPLRSYRCRNGSWRSVNYDSINFHVYYISDLLHEGDRVFRKELKTKRYLKERPDEAWATPIALQALAAERAAQEKTRRPKIVIDLSNLDVIRQDAAATRDSLLSEEEMAETGTGDETGAAGDAAAQPANAQPANAQPVAGASAEPGATPGATGAAEGAADDVGEGDDAALHTTVLRMLLAGKNPETYLRERRLLPSVVVDDINEALFEQIGDSVVDYDGSTMTLVEDYREDVAGLLGK